MIEFPRDRSERRQNFFKMVKHIGEKALRTFTLSVHPYYTPMLSPYRHPSPTDTVVSFRPTPPSSDRSPITEVDIDEFRIQLETMTGPGIARELETER